MSRVKELADALVEALECRPKDFRSDHFRLYDTKLNMSWWVANRHYGFALMHPDSQISKEIEIGRPGGFINWHGRRCWRAYKRWHYRYGSVPDDEFAATIRAENAKHINVEKKNLGPAYPKTWLDPKNWNFGGSKK